MKYLILFIGIFSAFFSVCQASDIKADFDQCTQSFKAEKESCLETQMTQCFEQKQSAYKEILNCYKKIGTDVLVKFYGLSEKTAIEKLDDFAKFNYDQYLFLNTKSNYCQKNNCGVDVYLQSQYAAIGVLASYVEKMIIYSVDR